MLTKALRNALEGLPVSMRTVAARAGVSPALLSMARGGERPATEETVRLVLQALASVQADVTIAQTDLAAALAAYLETSTLEAHDGS